jgi:hypothetical protein
VTEKTDLSGNTWFVYILRCDDGSLYTGITNDLIRRCDQNNTIGRFMAGGSNHSNGAGVCLCNDRKCLMPGAPSSTGFCKVERCH